MKNIITLISIIFSILFITGSTLSANDDFPVLKGPYLGQKPPGTIPKIFAPGIISTEKDEINGVFSVDGKEIYFSRDTYKNISKAGRDYTIFFMKQENNHWIKPQIVSFAGEFMNGDMFISWDNKTLFYCSDRPINHTGKRKEDSDIWRVTRKANGWSTPINLGQKINSNKNEWYPTLTKDGTLYFSSSREGGFGRSDVYRSRFEDGSFQQVENIGAPVNTKYGENDVFISPDENFLIFASSDRPGGYGSGDLYISFQEEKRSWTELINMGKPINSNKLEFCPMISPDGKYLFFSSRRRGNEDIYWVDAKIIEELRPKELK